MSEHRPVLGISIGDPGGIGPEIAVMTATDPQVVAACRPLLVGSQSAVERACAAAKIDAVVNVLEEGFQPDEMLFDTTTVSLVDTQSIEASALPSGMPTAEGGNASAIDTARAVALAVDGVTSGVVSAPVSKQSLGLGGHNYPGQTELIADLMGIDIEEVLTVLVGGPMRVALVSSHCSLRSAIQKATRARVLATILALNQAVRTGFGIENPRLGVAGLNPHAGDNRLLGDEDADELVPAVADAVGHGIDVVGPIPADALFQQGDDGKFDGIVSMYHDQGVIPLKRYRYATFAHGLPFVRTTAGHGTAYDLAGTGRADHTTLVNAVMLATQLLHKG